MIRKITLLSALSVAVGVSYGQVQQYNVGVEGPMKEYNQSKAIKPVEKPSNSNSLTKAYNVVWEEDFSGATAGTAPVIFSTTNGDYTIDGTDGAYWSQSSAANSPVNDPTNLTGEYLLWDSYSDNSNEANFATTPVNGAVRTPVIDLSGVASNELRLNFNTNTMYCCHPQEFPWVVSVSTDGGTTFGAPIMLDFNVDRNVNSNTVDTPVNYAINLAGELDANPANNDQVVIEFRWVGDNEFVYQSGGSQYNTHYFWALDDLEIYETPAYDLIMNNAWTGDIINDYEFSETPASLAGNFVAQAKLENNGLQTPTNVELKVDILDNGGTVVETATGGTLTNNFTLDVDTITFNTGIDLSAFAVGEYTVEYEVLFSETDVETSNNSRTRTFSITDNTFATYNADLPLSGESPGYSYAGGTPSASMKFGNVYMFDQEVILQGVEMAGHPGYQNLATAEDVPIEIFVEEFDNTAFTEDYVAGPYTYNVSQDKLSNDGSRYLYNLHQPDDSGSEGEVVLAANTLYVISFNHYGGDGSHFWYWGTPVDEDFSSRVYGPFGTQPGSSWFTIPWEPAMALNFDETLNLESEELLDRSLRSYPNPASESTTISYSLKNQAEVSVKIYDLSGNLVFEKDQGNQTSGNHKLNVNTSEFSNGMYTYTLSTDETVVTKKLIISN